MEEENENDFIFYQSEDADSGEFTYFAFLTGYDGNHVSSGIPLRRGVEDLQSWFEGNYAYRDAVAAIAEDYDQETMQNVIELFATENLSDSE